MARGILRGAITALAALALAACGTETAEEQSGPAPAPALWELTGDDGQLAYLFGTIHTLPEGANWRTGTIDRALAQSDMLVLEIAALDDSAAIAAEFARLGQSAGNGNLSHRIDPELRDELAVLLEQAGSLDQDFAQIESWAAALMLVQATAPADEGEGVDVALLRGNATMEVAELEGIADQLGRFDSLPEKEQVDLLTAVIESAPDSEAESKRLMDNWLYGDVEAMVEETNQGLLADPELRAALMTNRNREWVPKIEAWLAEGHKPFIAAGAAHMVGPDGLPAQLTQRGWTIKRIQ
ncbi:TraB/GumN family protein [Altererythrobacter sp. ZODW24]|uniref:TraB/GumN family protein n=1 Tax=Altererythrobacter sp. ZODW24 TaxID=2185142 RepID=UPI000DF7E5DC|nr:TraB/GumN family protein [Altererythrobacter sp. ZODW24]